MEVCVTKRIAAIAFIFTCTTIAWFILGSTINARTYSSDDELKQRVSSTWGTPQVQAPPTAVGTHVVHRKVEEVIKGHTQTRYVDETMTDNLLLESSRIDVHFDLEHRQKGLLWYSTYKIAFAGLYTFRNNSGNDKDVTFALKFPASKAVYDDLNFEVDSQSVSITNTADAAYAHAFLRAGQTALLRVSYRSQGLDQWTYKFDDGIAQVRDFVLTMHTNFRDIDFPADTLSPTEKHPTTSGWELVWNYKSLVSGFQIGMAMPHKLQPGPLTGQISYFAPVSLLFFFFLIFVITTIRNLELHPMNYFFLASAFFAFHLLMAYLVDHISIHAAFAICSVVSVFLVTSYLRLVIGMRFAAVEAGITQFIYLVLFSYAFFFPGFTGLAITIGTILTLFVVMQMTGRIRWAERFAAHAQALKSSSPPSNS